MKILVMGGTRFFGKLLAERLIEENQKVTILTRGITKDNFQDKVNRIVCLRSDRSGMEKALKGRHFDIIYDQICFSPDDAAISCDIFKEGVKRYIFTSSMLVYKEGKRMLKEEDFNPDLCKIKMGSREMLSYKEGKRFAEAYFVKKAEFPVVSVRFPVVMGSDDYTGRFIFHVERALLNKKILIPENSGRMNYINAKGAADFLFWLKEIDFQGQINAASPEAFNADELVGLFGEILKKKAKVVKKDINGDATISPYYIKGDMIMDVSRAKGLGYKFPSFFSWFPQEVKTAYSEMLSKDIA